MDQTTQPKLYNVTAIDLTHDALGVTRLDNGYTVFVEDLLKGESALIEITNKRSKYGFGKVVQRITRSPYRQAPKCKHFYECGGCKLMHMDYDVQSAFKKYRLEVMVKKLHLNPEIVEDIIVMVNPFYYRNKVEIKFAQGEKGIKAGFFKAKTHQVVNLDECYVMQKKSFELLTFIKNIINELKMEAYDPETEKGLFRSAVIRESNKYKEIVLLFNIAQNEFEQEKVFIDKITKNYPEVKGIGFVNSIDESSYSHDEIRIAFGREYLLEELLDNKYEIGFRSFFQVNTLQTARLYTKAIEYANLKGSEKIIDAYCGIGTISLSLANQVYKVFGIEVIESAIVDAKKNAEINEISNAFFEAGPAEKVIQKWKKYNFDTIFIDPPRKGCDDKFIKAIVDMKIPKIVYISCNPATFGRDLEKLIANGYELVKVTPVDMFPQTSHVESVGLLKAKR